MTSAGPDITAVRSHLVQGLGPPSDVLELSGSPDKKLPKLEVAMWTPAGPTGPAVLISCGMSKVAMPDQRRFEAVLIVRPVPSKEHVLQTVKLAGRFGLFLASATHAVPTGTVIRAPEELAGISSMTALVLMPAITFPPQFRQFKKGDKVAVDLVWLVPVHESEAQIVETHGAEALMMQFTAYGTDLATWHREAIPKLLSLDEAKAMVAARAPAPAAPAPGAESTKQERVAALKADAMARAASSPSGAPQPASGAPQPASGAPQHAPAKSPVKAPAPKNPAKK